MTSSTSKNLKKSGIIFSFFTLPLLLGSLISNAQVRIYSIVYTDNIKGSTTIFGNTLMNIVDADTVDTKKMNGNRSNGNSIYGNNRENMQYVDIDGNSGNGALTRNSSSSDLVLPGGTNSIKLARLYWGGQVLNNEFNLRSSANRKVKLRKGTSGSYSDVTAMALDTFNIHTQYSQYQAFADITSFVQTNGTGTYEVGNVPLSKGSVDSGDYNGGWCIVVVYENNNLPYNSIRVYDGFNQVYNGGVSLSTAVTLTGLNVPSGALLPSDAQMGVVAWEGDANLKQDFLKINGFLFSNATNQADNPWNGTITNNGVHVTTKNPNYTNQMGIDIDQFNVGTGYGISPNDNSVSLEFGTEADRYFPGLFTFSIKVKDPTISVNKTVLDANGNNMAEKNEVLTYTLKGENLGRGNANSVIINDTLPSTVTYVPNSLKIISSPGVTPGDQTDVDGDDNAEYIVNGLIKSIRFRIGRGSTNTNGGILEPNESYEVQYQVTVNDPGANNEVPSIINIAKIVATSDAEVAFVDDGTAIINAEGGPLPVTLVSFTALLQQDNLVKINWATSMEINCSKYIVERSEDGRLFIPIATVAGNGTSSLMHYYSAADNVAAVNGAVVYFRLKQIDIDGKENISKVVALKIKKVDTEMSISPNPFNSYLNVNMEWSNNEVITAKVINAQGMDVIAQKIQMTKGLNYIRITELAKLPAGNYFLQFVSTAQKITKPITKQ